MKNKITPKFNHRFVQSFHDDRDLTDSVNVMTCRAKSVLYLLSAQFEMGDDHTLCNGTIYDSIHSVICELDDIQAYLRAFSESRKEKEFDVQDYLKTLGQ